MPSPPIIGSGSQGEDTVLYQRGSGRHVDARHPRLQPTAVLLVIALCGAVLGSPGGASAADPQQRVRDHGVALRVAGEAAPAPTSPRSPTPALPRLGWPGEPVARDDEAANAHDPSAMTGAGSAPTAHPAIGPAAAASGPGVVPGNSFDGLTDLDNMRITPECEGLTQRPCGEPADPWVAVGPDHVLQVVNWRVRVTDRAGANAAGRSTEGWFANSAISPGRAPFNTDARVLYDRGRGRWLASNLSFDCTGSVLTVMVSRDPGGSPRPLSSDGWTRYRISLPGEVADFPTLGASTDLVAVGANRYPVSCPDPGGGEPGVQPIFGDFSGASLFVFDWDTLLAAPADLPFVDLGPTLETGASPSLFTFAPARQISPSDRLHVVVAARAGAAAPDAIPLSVGYTSVTGTVGDGTTTATVAASPLALVDGVSLSRPPAPVDPGGKLTQAVDFRITDAVWRGSGAPGAGRLAFASTITSGGSSPRPRARIVELLTPAPGAGGAGAMPATLAQVLTVTPAYGYTDTFMPGVAYAYDGTLWAVHSQSGPRANIATWANRQHTGARAAVPAEAAFSPGSARVAIGRDAYAGINRRWGDSVGVAPDPLPANAGSAWQANQFADLLEGWATFVARLDDDSTGPPAPPWLVQTIRVGQAATPTSVDLIVFWAGVGDLGSGVERYQVQRDVSGTWENVPLSTPRALSVGQQVPIGVGTRFRVRAFDHAGNASPWRFGRSFTPEIVRPTASAGASFVRTWGRRSCSTCLAPSVRFARTAGATASLRTTAQAIAWVTATGPTRGSARVRVDGTLQRTVSTHAATVRTRIVKAAASWRVAGPHRFAVEVVGTRRHPLVDVDVFIVLR